MNICTVLVSSSLGLLEYVFAQKQNESVLYPNNNLFIVALLRLIRKVWDRR